MLKLHILRHGKPHNRVRKRVVLCTFGEQKIDLHPFQIWGINNGSTVKSTYCLISMKVYNNKVVKKIRNFKKYHHFDYVRGNAMCTVSTVYIEDLYKILKSF